MNEAANSLNKNLRGHTKKPAFDLVAENVKMPET